MDILLGALLIIVVLTWAYRIETNTRKTQESVERIEKLLTEKKEKK